MDCCCRPEYPVIPAQDRQTDSLQQTPKLKFSFRTQQATTATRYTNAHTVTSFDANIQHFSKDQKYAMGSTVASNTELIELQREREYLMQEDRNLDIYYQQAIVPLERQVQFYEKQVKIRSIQIMQLEDLLQAKIHELNSVPSYEPNFVQPPQQFFGNHSFFPPQSYTAQNTHNFAQNAPVSLPVTIRPTRHHTQN